MKLPLTLFLLLLANLGLAQQYDSVVFEEENIDENNTIYRIGSVFVYDYEIIRDGKKWKLNTNKGMQDRAKFELVPIDTDSIAVDKIHLIVQPIPEAFRTNENQTQISYLQGPVFASMSMTGAAENEQNVWIHPIRRGFFNSLETAPFPFVKFPLAVGSEWTDKMKIGEGWGNDIWGTWDDHLLLSYTYRLTDRKTIKTEIGKVDCYIVESAAASTIGTTKLTSYFSEKYGFVKLEYELLNDLKVNLWMIDVKTDQKFNDSSTFFKTKEYIKK